MPAAALPWLAGQGSPSCIAVVEEKSLSLWCRHRAPGAWAGPKVHVGNLCSALALEDENENLLAALQAAEDASV